MRFVLILAIVGLAASAGGAASWVKPPKMRDGVRVGVFDAEVRRVYGLSEGLPDPDVRCVALSPERSVYAGTTKGLVRVEGERAIAVEGMDTAVDAVGLWRNGVVAFCAAQVFQVREDKASAVATFKGGQVLDIGGVQALYIASDNGLFRLDGQAFVGEDGLHVLLGTNLRVNQLAFGPDGELAVAAEAGLFARADGRWDRLIPDDGARRWAVAGVRGVAFDEDGRLWCASPQGAACREEGAWRLYTGYEGVPYDDFTTMARGEDGVVWFGMRIGAIRYDGAHWAYRQGRRWLPHDEVREIAVDADGNAWFATAGGLGVIERRATTLAEKARFFEDEIDAYHRRTPYGFVDAVHLKTPGDKSEWTQSDSDNDGLWTGMYGAGECFAWAATRDPKAKDRAKAAFEALRFLRVVAEGCEHEPPAGFVARSILPTSGPDPNEGRLEDDRRRRDTDDTQWKVFEPRWPK
ncbi:MAG TPA: hypothetical protein ENN80_15730, partial [Candidatus Hydrogenedentes bacterium]|nr:hypothetical protein [Candidatus Hydrogenedentota bacterium]